MADYPDGIQPTQTTIEADTTGLALDDHIYSSSDGLSVYDHTKDIRTQVDSYLVNLDIKLSEIKATGTQTARTLSDLYDMLKSILDGEQLYEQLLNADETTAQSITLDTIGHGEVVSIYANATTATTYTVQVSNDNTNWINVYTSSSAETTYSGSLTDEFKGFRYVKLSSAAAGSSGDTVTLIVCAK